MEGPTRPQIPSREPAVLVLDQDSAVCQALRAIAGPFGVAVEFYRSAEPYFQSCDPDQPGCLFADPDTPGVGGLGFFARLARHRVHLPVVFTSPCGEVPAVVLAMKAGAFDYLQKPCDPADLGRVLAGALQWDAENHQRIVGFHRVQRRLGCLTPAERDVLQLLLAGMGNRAMAAELHVSVRAIEVRRAKIMEKMKAHSLAELVCHAVTGLLGDFAPEGRRDNSPASHIDSGSGPRRTSS